MVKLKDFDVKIELSENKFDKSILHKNYIFNEKNEKSCAFKVSKTFFDCYAKEHNSTYIVIKQKNIQNVDLIKKCISCFGYPNGRNKVTYEDEMILIFCYQK